MKLRRIACLFGMALLLCACGADADDTLNVCDPGQWPSTSRRSCGWPCCECGIEESTLFKAYVPAGTVGPVYLVMDIKTRSDSRSGVCRDGELVVSGPSGEVSRDRLELDVATRICDRLDQAGTYTVEMICPSYPSVIQYQATVVDGAGVSVFP